RLVRNPPALHARIEALSKELGVEVFPVNSSYSDDASVGLGSFEIRSLSTPQIAVIADDMVFHTSFGAIWHLLEQQAGLRFTPIRVGSIRAQNLEQFNVVIFPEGFGYAGALGKPGIDALKEWIARGGVVIGVGSGGNWFYSKEAAITSASPVGAEPE